MVAADLEGFFLNCFIGGETVTVQPDGSPIKNKIELAFGGHNVTIIQRPEIISAKRSEYRGLTVPTTSVVVHNVDVEEREKILHLLRGLAHLLSFATCSDVAFYQWEHPGSRPSGGGWSVVARMGYFRPPFNISDGKAIRTYLERVWREYFRLEERRKLPVAIHLFVLAETRSLPLELKLATMFILLENLKSSHAEEQGYPFEDGYFRKASGKKWSFKALLLDMFKQVHMPSPDLSAIVDLRNDIIHSGISQTSGDHQQDIYDNCQDLVREYLLRLLDYTGNFRLYSDRGMAPKRI
jgi:hypothetical protein